MLDATGRAAALARPRGRAERPAVRPPVTHCIPRYLARHRQDADERIARPDRLQRRTRGFARIGRTRSRGPCSSGPCATRTTRRAHRPFFERPRRAAHSRRPRSRRSQAGQWEGLGRRPHVARAWHRPIRTRSIWNLTGQPAVSVPTGMSDDGAPDRHAARGPPRRGGHAALARRAARGASCAGPTTGRLSPERSLPRVRQVRIQDTLSGGVAPARAARAGRIGIYACGPTVYGRVHVGNARPYVVFSLLKRFLEHEGYDTIARDQHHRRERQDLRRRPRARRAERGARARDDRRLRGGHRPRSGSGGPDHEPKATRDDRRDHRADRGAGRVGPRLRARAATSTSACPPSPATASSRTARWRRCSRARATTPPS